MEYEWDENKNAVNQSKHKIDFSKLEDFEWDRASIFIDDRKTYGEIRYCALGVIGNRLYHLVYTHRNEAIRIISLRRANKREVKKYAETQAGNYYSHR